MIDYNEHTHTRWTHHSGEELAVDEVNEATFSMIVINVLHEKCSFYVFI